MQLLPVFRHKQKKVVLNELHFYLQNLRNRLTAFYVSVSLRHIDTFCNYIVILLLMFFLKHGTTITKTWQIHGK